MTSLDIGNTWSITNDINIDIKIQYLTTSEKPTTEKERKWFELQKPNNHRVPTISIDIDNGDAFRSDSDSYSESQDYIDIDNSVEETDNADMHESYSGSGSMDIETDDDSDSLPLMFPSTSTQKSEASTMPRLDGVYMSTTIISSSTSATPMTAESSFTSGLSSITATPSSTGM